MRKGISLIILVITIIVIIILATAVILSLSQNNPIQKSSEAVFKSDLTAIKDSLSLYIASEYYAKGLSPIELNSDIASIVGFDKYNDKFVIKSGVLYCTNKVTAIEKTNCAELGVKQMTSLNNLVANGDFSNGETMWNGSYSTIVASNKTLVNTANGIVSYSQSNQSKLLSGVAGNKFYVRGSLRTTNSSCYTIFMQFATNVNYNAGQIFGPTPNQWYTLSGIVTSSQGYSSIHIKPTQDYRTAVTSEPPYNDSTNYVIGNEVSYNSKAYVCIQNIVGNNPSNTSYWRLKNTYNKVMESKEILVIDLTATFGAGNEPSKEEMDSIPYFTQESGAYEYVR